MLSCIHIFSDRIQSAGADIFNGSNFCSGQRTHGSDAGALRLAVLVNGTGATERDTQPNLVPVKPKVSRKYQSSGISGSPSKVGSMLFTLNSIISSASKSVAGRYRSLGCTVGNKRQQHFAFRHVHSTLSCRLRLWTLAIHHECPRDDTATVSRLCCLHIATPTNHIEETLAGKQERCFG
jgi:hypothetical protein